MSIMEGTLYKKGGHLKKWKKKSFSIIGNIMVYGKKKTKIIKIPSPENINFAPKCKRNFAFTITVPNKVYFLAAETKEEMDNWVSTLQRITSGLQNINSSDELEVVQILKVGDEVEMMVVKQKDVDNDKEFLLKKIKSKSTEIEIEIGLIERLLHKSSPFISRLNCSFEENENKYLIFDFLKDGKLFDKLYNEDKKFQFKDAQKYAAELFLAIKFLHDNNLIYGDLNPDRIILNKMNHIRLMMPGLSKSTEITPYTAPEIIRGETPTKQTDWYCYGVLVYEMICGFPPFWEETTELLSNAILNEKEKFPNHVVSNISSFLTSLLNKEPSQRFNKGDDIENEIKSHPFFTGIKWVSIESIQ